MSNQLSIALCVVCTMIGYAYADIEKCTEPIKHYKELGCHPAVEEGKHCPTRYICPYIPHFEPDVCHYKEVMYYTTQRLADEVTADQCVQKCVCSDEATPSVCSSSPLFWLLWSASSTRKRESCPTFLSRRTSPATDWTLRTIRTRPAVQAPSLPLLRSAPLSCQFLRTPSLPPATQRASALPFRAKSA